MKNEILDEKLNMIGITNLSGSYMKSGIIFVQ